MVRSYPTDRDIERGGSPRGPWSSSNFRALARNAPRVLDFASTALVHAGNLATEHLPRLAQQAPSIGLAAAYVQAASNNFWSQGTTPSDTVVWNDNIPTAQDSYRFHNGIVQPAPSSRKQSLNPGRASNLATLGKRRQPQVGPGPKVRRVTPPTPKAWYKLASSPSTPTQTFSQYSQGLRSNINARYRLLRGKTRSRRNCRRAKLLFARNRKFKSLSQKRRILLAAKKSAQWTSRSHRRIVREHQRFRRKYG